MSERLVFLQGGLVVPVEAVAAALAIERAGHRLMLDGPDLLIEPRGALDQHDVEELRRWKPHVKLLLAYMPSDAHLRDHDAPAPDCGPVVRRPS